MTRALMPDISALASASHVAATRHSSPIASPVFGSIWLVRLVTPYRGPVRVGREFESLTLLTFYTLLNYAAAVGHMLRLRPELPLGEQAPLRHA
jgi:hypothetical protein